MGKKKLDMPQKEVDQSFCFGIVIHKYKILCNTLYLKMVIDILGF